VNNLVDNGVRKIDKKGQKPDCLVNEQSRNQIKINCFRMEGFWSSRSGPNPAALPPNSYTVVLLARQVKGADMQMSDSFARF
jgi:hypothetical protein